MMERLGIKKVQVEHLNLLDTEYIEILTNSCNPDVELRLIKLGIEPAEARRKTQFLMLVQNKPQTPQEWEILLDSWESAYGYQPTEEQIQMVSRLVWE